MMTMQVSQGLAEKGFPSIDRSEQDCKSLTVKKSDEWTEGAFINIWLEKLAPWGQTPPGRGFVHNSDDRSKIPNNRSLGKWI